MRFIAMTAAISIGIISTSTNSHRRRSSFDASERASSSSGRPSNMIGNGRGEDNPILAKHKVGKAFIRSNGQSQDTIADADDGDNNQSMHQISAPSTREKKGKMLIKESPSSDMNYYTERQYAGNMIDNQMVDFGHSGPSGRKAIDAVELVSSKQLPVKPHGVVASRLPFRDGDPWFANGRIDEESEENPMLNIKDEISIQRSNGENNISSLDRAKDKTFSNHRKEIADRKESRSPDITNIYRRTTDDNNAEIRRRKNAISEFKEKHSDERVRGHRRSSSVDRVRPMVFNRPSPDQPGLKQILMEMSRDRASKFQMSDTNVSGDIKSYGRKESDLQKSTRPQQVSTMSTAKSPLNPERVDRKQILPMGTDSNKARTFQMGANTQADAIDLNYQSQDHGAYQKQKLDHKHRTDTDGMKPSVRGTMQKKVYGTLADKEESKQKLDSDSQAGSTQVLRKETDAKMENGKQRSRIENSADSSQIWNGDKLRYSDTDAEQELSKILSNHKGGAFKQSSKHSRSTLNSDHLDEQVSQNPQTARLPAGVAGRGHRRSISYDIADASTPDWLKELEPPPPPPSLFEEGSTSTAAEQSSASNSEALGIEGRDYENLVPWRTSAPINIPEYTARSPSPSLMPGASGPSRGELNRQANEFISNFLNRLLQEKQASLERRSNNPVKKDDHNI
ncbi:hypothetical protein KP509_29G044500 [Ceratopteris richardii]|nr:hypothetical protein KP509_29G044500 [Ceratopteris richardii]